MMTLSRNIIAATVGASFVCANVAVAQTPAKSGPGQSEFAPGRQVGPAKKSAPGQRMLKKDNPKSPGASESAPGQQKSGTKPPALKK